MVQVVRRAGIAVGSFVAAWLVVWLVGVALLPLFGVPVRPLDSGSTAIGGVLPGLVTIVLGGLIYRDIVRRETRAR